MKIVEVKLADGSIVSGELVTKTTPRVPVTEKSFAWVDGPTTWKGKQRQIVVDILRAAQSPMEYQDIVDAAAAKGLQATGGVPDSVKYHLHQLVLLGHVAE